jgi:hypothetical protein
MTEEIVRFQPNKSNLNMQCFVKKEKKILTEVWKKGTNERKTQKIKKNLRITLTRNVCWFILRGLTRECAQGHSERG